jgi:hypothetical protein
MEFEKRRFPLLSPLKSVSRVHHLVRSRGPIAEQLRSFRSETQLELLTKRP